MAPIIGPWLVGFLYMSHSFLCALPLRRGNNGQHPANQRNAHPVTAPKSVPHSL